MSGAPPPASDPEHKEDYYQTGGAYDAHRAPRPAGQAGPPPPAAASSGAQVLPVQYGANAGAVAAGLAPAVPVRPAPTAPGVPPGSHVVALDLGSGQVHNGVLLPVGAVPMNGGIMYSANLFSNSYRVPGPKGENYIYYDKSMPMPPVTHYPTLSEQWYQMTFWLKLFLVLLLLFWGLQWLIHWKVALFMPILFLPTWLLYKQWQKHYESVELYMLLKLYATAFAPGALVVLLVESIMTVVFMFVCFQSYIADFGANPTPTPTDPDLNPGKHHKHGNDDQAPDGMEFLNYPATPQLFVFLLLLSYISAGCVEESLKYFCTNSVKEHRPSYKVLYGYGLYAIASALGFSSVENIGYVLGGALGPGGDDSLLGVFLNVCGRTFISTPLHLMTGYLIGLQVIRRDVFGEALSIFKVMGWSVFFHGSFDFGLFVIMALQSKWSSGPDDVTVSYILMGCVVVNCYCGLAYRIWRTRQKVFQRVEVHEEEANAPGAGSVPVPAGAVGANGFSRLNEQAV